MSVEFSCQHCGQEMRADGRHVGRRVRCPGCEQLIVVPKPPAAEKIVELEPIEGPAGRSQDSGVRSQDSGVRSRKGEDTEPPAKRKQSARAKQPRNDARRAPVLAAPPPAAPSGSPAFSGPEPPILPPPVVAPPLDQSANNALAPPAAPEPPSVAGAGLLLPPRRTHPEDLIDMTAMVDIVFFLLIFFLVTSIQSLQAVMDMPTPQASEGGVSTGRSVADLENDPNFITVRIEDDDSIWVEDTQVFSDQELILRLRAAKGESDGPRSLLVIGHADASHGAAVRAFDAGAAAAVNGISLIVQEDGG